MAGEMERLPPVNITNIVGTDATGVGGLMDLTAFTNLVISNWLASLPRVPPPAGYNTPWINGNIISFGVET